MCLAFSWKALWRGPLAPVLNETDIESSVPPLAILAAMSLAQPHSLPTGVERYARAPRFPGDERERQWLRLPPPALQGALLALVGRDTSTLPLSSEQRLSHFPASPLVTLSWYAGMGSGLMAPGAQGPLWHPFDARIVLSGSQSHPIVSWAPTTGRGYMACFAADAAQALFGIELAAIQDRFIPAFEVLDARWTPLLESLLDAPDEALPGVLESHLAPRWQALQGRSSAHASLRQMGRHWMSRLAWKAQQWRSSTSERQVERRIKTFSGRSLREWQSLVRTEGLFFAARERYEQGLPLDWAALAQDEGFSDQSHMSRAAKRITGFAPGEFAQRFIEDESFWMYRLWM